MAREGFKLEVVGVSEIQKTLVSMGDDVRRKQGLFRRVHNQLLRPVKDKVKNRIFSGRRLFGTVQNKRSGLFRVVGLDLKSQVVILNDKFNKSGKILTISPAESGGRRAIPYGRFLEYGTTHRNTRGAGADRGKINAQPFFRPEVLKAVGAIQSKGLAQYDRLIVDELRRDVNRLNGQVKRKLAILRR